jgi:hypothetical protein
MYKWITFAVIGVGLPIAAAAQAPATQTDESKTTTTVETTQTQTTTTTTDDSPGIASHWLASGFVGSNFGRDSDEASVDFGGTLGYLWRGVLGGEFQANFSPDFKLEGTRRALLINDEPWINSYMMNAIAAVPIGSDGGWQPFVSGGVGVLTLQSDVLQSSEGNLSAVEPDDSRFAGNIGAGIMGIVGNAGVRGEVRFFRGFEEDFNADPIESPAEAVGTRILSDLQFWRANIGIAFRW